MRRRRALSPHLFAGQVCANGLHLAFPRLHLTRRCLNGIGPSYVLQRKLASVAESFAARTSVECEVKESHRSGEATCQIQRGRQGQELTPTSASSEVRSKDTRVDSVRPAMEEIVKIFKKAK